MISASRWALATAAILVVSTWAAAAPTEEPASAPAPAEDVMTHVPAGCTGLLVVRNIKAFAGQIDRFARQISPPGQPLLPKSVLEMIKEDKDFAQINPDAGLAVVLLDPAKYGIDLPQMIKLAATRPAALAETKEWPVVVLVGAKDPTTVLSKDFKLQADGLYQDKDSWACKAGGYVAISPCKKALDAVVKPTKLLQDELSEADRDLLKRNAVAVWVNVRQLAPSIDAGAKVAEELLKALDLPEEELAKMGSVKSLVELYRSGLTQMDSLAIGGRIAASGILLEFQVNYLPDSVMGKALSAIKPSTGPLLDRLPALPYVLAVGSRQGSDFSNPKEAQALLDMPPFNQLPPKDRQRLQQLVNDSAGQVDGYQIFVGSAPGGGLGVGVWLKCKSAQKVKDLLVDAVGLAPAIQELVKNEAAGKFSVKYVKSAEKVGAIEVDAIELHMNLPGNAEGNGEENILPDKIRVLVATLDQTTLALTFGGTTMMSEMVRSAAGGGKLEADPMVAQALAALPQERSSLVLFNITHLLSLVTHYAKAHGEESPLPVMPPTVPLAGAIAIQKTTLNFTGYIPANTVREVIKAIQSMFNRPAPGQPPPPVDL